MLFVVGLYARGQATLPFTYDGGNPATGITGLTSTGLGADYGTSPKMKFSAAGNSVILNFSGIPGTLRLLLFCKLEAYLQRRRRSLNVVNPSRATPARA